jgi:acetate kinase
MAALLASPEPRAAAAVESFVYQVARAIGSLAVALGGLDAVIFTGGIGANSAEIRRRVVAQIAWLGATLDEPAHAAGRAVFSAPDSAITLCQLATDEELVMARQAAALLAPAASDRVRD